MHPYIRKAAGGEMDLMRPTIACLHVILVLKTWEVCNLKIPRISIGRLSRVCRARCRLIFEIITFWSWRFADCMFQRLNLKRRDVYRGTLLRPTGGFLHTEMIRED